MIVSVLPELVISKSKEEFSCTWDGLLAFKCKIESVASEDLFCLMPGKPPNWLMKSPEKSIPKKASYLHPFIQWSGEFCWRQYEWFGQNWSVADLVCPGDLMSPIGLLDSIFSQCLLCMQSREVFTIRSVRRIVIMKDVFDFKEYRLFVRMGTEIDAWLCCKEVLHVFFCPKVISLLLFFPFSIQLKKKQKTISISEHLAAR